MATEVTMPKLGLTMKEGVIGKWLKADGEPVTKDEIIAIVVTKKITHELKATASGILRITARVNATLPIAGRMGFILAPGEAMPAGDEPVTGVEEPAAVETPPAAAAAAPAPTPAAPPAPAAPQPGEFVVASPSARRLAREAHIDLVFVTGSGPSGRVSEEDVKAYLTKREAIMITPAARRLAEEHCLDITRIAASGPGGRITEADVEAVINPPAPAPAPAAVPAPAAPTPDGKRVPFSGMRQMIAENMTLSLQSMAQVTMFTEVDVTELVGLRERLKKDFDLTYTDLIVRAVAFALKKHPRLNATLSGEEIQLLPDINIGVGVALEEGLIVPVIQNADRLSVKEVGVRLRELGAKARSNSLDVDELSGGTFTISNLGAYGVDGFTPVINPPEVAILGVGRIQEKPVVFRGEIAKRAMLTLSLTFDHRLVDGAPAAAFLQTLADHLNHPYFIGG